MKVGKDLKVSINDAIELLGNLRDVITRGDKVLVKPNFNSPDAFPGSTDLLFLRGMIEMLVEAGARVTIGESSGGIWRPTKNVFHKLGLYELARKLNVKLLPFDKKGTDWVKIEINGSYLRSVTMPRVAYEADKIVYLPCMKTHRLAGYSGALKLAFGFVHPGERRGFHLRHLQRKLAEVSLCWQPDLIVIDGMKTFVTGGPDKGQLAEPGLLLASGDIVAIDLEAVKVILAYGAKNRLPSITWQLPQIATALKHGFGFGASEYTVIEQL
ncbi:DUF362 domain-containing protein [Chloroflexota bacterium]